MRTGSILVLLFALVGISVWFWQDHHSLVGQLSEVRQQTSMASTSTSGLALANCMSLAEVEYDEKWNSLCEQEGQADYCVQFVGSPRDVQFTQIKDQEKAQCITLYK